MAHLRNPKFYLAVFLATVYALLTISAMRVFLAWGTL